MTIHIPLELLHIEMKLFAIGDWDGSRFDWMPFTKILDTNMDDNLRMTLSFWYAMANSNKN